MAIQLMTSVHQALALIFLVHEQLERWQHRVHRILDWQTLSHVFLPTNAPQGLAPENMLATLPAPCSQGYAGHVTDEMRLHPAPLQCSHQKYFIGTVYRAANWVYVGDTKGFRRTRQGYSATAQSPKMVFVKPLQAKAQTLLSQPILQPHYRTGGHKIMLSAKHMQSLPDFFRGIPDPRRGQGRRHSLSTVLGIVAGAVLCGMRGYQAISDWAQSLGPKARERFNCRRENGRYVVPSNNVIRDVLIRVDPAEIGPCPATLEPSPWR